LNLLRSHSATAKTLMLLTLVCIIIPTFAVAFSYSHGENKTIYPKCVNATSGAFLGTNANLTVRNESGIFYEVDALDNVDTGVFMHHLHNLSLNHCYSLELGCEDTGTWRNEWGTVCVNQSTTSATVSELGTGFADLGAVLGALFGSVLMAFFAFALGSKWPVLNYFFVPASLLFALLSINTGLKAAEAAGASAGVISAMDTSLWVCVTVLVITFFVVGFGGVKQSLDYFMSLNSNKLGGKLK